MKVLPGLFFALFLLSSQLFSQNFYRESSGTAKDRLFGIGGQATYPVAGLSLKFNFGDHAAAQGVLGMLGIAGVEMRSFHLRGLFRFNEVNFVEPYLYGSIGYLEITSTSVFSASLVTKETFPGYGFGVGIEYESKSIPDVALNGELGYGTLRNKRITVEFSRITYGVGIHYYIMR